MKKLVAVGLSLLLSVFLAAGSLFAGEGASEFREGAAHSAGEMLTLPVHDQQGQEIGILEDIMLDLSTNQVAYGVVRVDESSHIVPWAAFTSPHEGPFLTLEAHRQTVTAAPSPPSPGQLDQAFGQEVHEHFGISPYWDEEARERPRTPVHPTHRPAMPGPPGEPPVRGR